MSNHTLVRASVFTALTILALASLACSRLSLPNLGGKAAQPTQAASPEALVVRSYPSGLKVYVTPQSKLTGGDLDTYYLTSKDYFVGYTPVETKLEPGEYRVTVTNFDNPIDFREDGEVSKIFSLDLDGNKVAGLKPAGKTYAVTKRTGHTALVTALFWPKGQSLEEFVKALPGDEVFKAAEADFEKLFQKHGVPQKDWADLLSMLRRTGKAVWYDTDPAHYLIVYFIEPDQVTVSFGNP